ncbi:two-component regulator propeller domain-containing protein [Euzebyella saccharophila]|uniref:Two-component regulator propeller domain-containing protein n=1 Tax=Euzebyella saccharophila TaxID=679664 RepID=A0ABV8JWL0_9FLAO
MAFAILFSIPAKSQENFHFEHLGTDEGMSQSDVNCIYQDSYGFMWFGTHEN